MALLYDLPLQEVLDNWKKIKVLVAPLGTRSVVYDGEHTKQYFLDLGFKEISIGTAPERIKMVGKNIQGQQKQYGLKHRVSSTIHAAMGIHYSLWLQKYLKVIQTTDCGTKVC